MLESWNDRRRGLASFLKPTGLDVDGNVSRFETNRAATVANSDDWDFSRLDELVNQTSRDVEPVGDIGDRQKSI